MIKQAVTATSWACCILQRFIVRRIAARRRLKRRVRRVATDTVADAITTGTATIFQRILIFKLSQNEISHEISKKKGFIADDSEIGESQVTVPVTVSSSRRSCLRQIRTARKEAVCPQLLQAGSRHRNECDGHARRTWTNPNPTRPET